MDDAEVLCLQIDSKGCNDGRATIRVLKCDVLVTPLVILLTVEKILSKSGTLKVVTRVLKFFGQPETLLMIEMVEKILG